MARAASPAGNAIADSSHASHPPNRPSRSFGRNTPPSHKGSFPSLYASHSPPPLPSLQHPSPALPPELIHGDPDVMDPDPESAETSMRPPTNYAAFVTGVLGDMTHQSAAVDQRVLCHCLELASSYLVTDATMNSANGISTWITGFSRLVSVLEALHIRGELELDTVNAASKACSECWTVAGSWRDLHDSREGVRGVAGRLKRLLDENGRTFQGARVYVP